MLFLYVDDTRLKAQVTALKKQFTDRNWTVSRTWVIELYSVVSIWSRSDDVTKVVFRNVLNCASFFSEITSQNIKVQNKLKLIK